MEARLGRLEEQLESVGGAADLHGVSRQLKRLQVRPGAGERGGGGHQGVAEKEMMEGHQVLGKKKVMGGHQAMGHTK